MVGVTNEEVPAKRGVAFPVLDQGADERRRREEWEEAEDWAAIDRLRERNKDADPDEVMAVVTEVVEEVRREMYAEEQRAAPRRR